MTGNFTALFQALLPEAALVVGALLVLGLDLIAGRNREEHTRLLRSVVVGLVAIGIAFWQTWHAGPSDTAAFGLVIDPLARAARLGVLVLGGLTVGLTSGARPLRNVAEYVAVILFALCGFMLMAAAANLLTAFLALELASLSLYILAGFDKTRAESAEAALKYFLLGGISAAFLLFGFSLIYGLTGSIELVEIARQLQMMPANTLLIVALVMVLAAFGFKAAAAPFHLWAPDVYQGAPAPSAALIASASKLAGYLLFLRLLWTGFGPAAGSVSAVQGGGGWLSAVAIVSIVSLLLGNLAALAQRNVRRLLAYSAIAHAGALLIGVMASGQAGTGNGPAAVFYYASTYGLATVGAFGVIALVDRAGRCQDLTDLAGLHRRSPFLAGCLFICVLSLAGIPPLAGFFGKFLVFTAALQMGGLGTTVGWLALAAIALSAVALYYYLLILKQALVAPPAQASGPIAVPVLPAIVLALVVVGLIGLGLFPSLLLHLF
jgi:NADH-quinone oxidoreductase subunit N